MDGLKSSYSTALRVQFYVMLASDRMTPKYVTFWKAILEDSSLTFHFSRSMYTEAISLSLLSCRGKPELILLPLTTNEGVEQ